MGDYDTKQSDIVEAARVVRNALSARRPTQDYSEGSLQGDTIVDGHAVVYAILRNQLAAVKNRLSLRDIQKLPDAESVRDAADAILSNFLRDRAQGRFSKGVATLHFSQRADVLLSRDRRFFWDAQHVFYLESESDLVISASQLRPSTSPSGTVTDYTYQVRLTAARVGSDYNVSPKRFLAVDPFSPFFLYAENTTAFQDGSSQQLTTDYVDSAKNALSIRALINARSNDSLLRGDLYPQIQHLLTVNYGDPEMQRDLATDTPSRTALHIGGKTDIYVWLQTQEAVARATVGALTPRADGNVHVFRDSAAPFASVQPGDILFVASGVPEAPVQYRVHQKNSSSELEVSARTPFSVATDEALVPPSIAYSIGNNYPAFDNKVASIISATARTSRKFAVHNGIILPGGPLYRVKQVELVTVPVALNAYRNSVSGGVVFSVQQNAPLTTPTPGDPLPFRIVCLNAGEGQSSRAVQYVEIGWAGVDLDGLQVDITYETVTGFEEIDSYVSDSFNRTNGADPLLRAFHPIYLSFTIPYRARVSGNALLTVNEAKVARTLIVAVRDTPFGLNIDAGTLGSTAKEADAAIAGTYNFPVRYSLQAPDGTIYRFETDDIVTVFPDGVTSSARLLNPEDFDLDPASYYAPLKRQLQLLGVSDRTIRYLAASDAVTLEQRGV
jgi:hypothetical protein